MKQIKLVIIPANNIVLLRSVPVKRGITSEARINNPKLAKISDSRFICCMLSFSFTG